MKTITREFLASGKTKLDRACADQLEIFSAEWPDGMPVTAENILRAYDILDVEWFVDHKLPAPAWAVYEAAIDPAWAVYKAAIAPAWAVYEAARFPALAAYEAAIAPILADIILRMEDQP